MIQQNLVKIVIGNGKLSNDISNFDDAVLSHNDIEIKNDPIDLVKILSKNVSVLNKKFPDRKVYVVNTAAKINLEWCEENIEECYNVNTKGAYNVAVACNALNLPLVHISSGCIFNGGITGLSINNLPFTEDDTHSPACNYAYTKSEADRIILKQRFDTPVYILRPRQIVSSTPNSTNMLTKFLSLGEQNSFITTQNSITATSDIARFAEYLIEYKHKPGIYNCVSSGTISPYEIAVKLKKLNPKLKPKKIEYEKYAKTLSVMRVNTILDISKLLSTGYEIASAKDTIDSCINLYNKVKVR